MRIVTKYQEFNPFISIQLLHVNDCTMHKASCIGPNIVKNSTVVETSVLLTSDQFILSQDDSMVSVKKKEPTPLLLSNFLEGN